VRWYDRKTTADVVMTRREKIKQPNALQAKCYQENIANNGVVFGR